MRKGWKDLPDYEKFIRPGGEIALDVPDSVPDETAAGDTNPVSHVPNSNDRRLLTTCKPHARHGDKARVGDGLKHARDKSKGHHVSIRCAA